MDEKKLTLDELVLELKAHVMAIRSAVAACDELGEDRYMSVAIVPDSEEKGTLHAWFNNHPEKKSTTPGISYILGYDPDDYYKWEEHV